MKHRIALFAIPLLLFACSSSRGRVKTETTIGTEVLEVMMPRGKEIYHQEHGDEVVFLIGPVSGVEGTAANGLGQMSVFENGKTIATLVVNIHPVPGFRLVGWLKDSAGNRVRLDQLLSPTKDVRHAVSVTVDKDLSAYTQIEVTKENTSGASENDPVVATGVMKIQKRGVSP